MIDKLDTKPFDRSDLQKCHMCGHGMMHGGQIYFYEVTVGQCIVDLKAVQEQHGLELMMGAAAPLAHVFSPTTTVAHRLPTERRLICADCFMGSGDFVRMLEDE